MANISKTVAGARFTVHISAVYRDPLVHSPLDHLGRDAEHKPARGSVLDRIGDASERVQQDRLSVAVKSLVKAGESVFLASGSTTLWAGLALISSVPDLKVVTNSIPLAMKAVELSRDGRLAPRLSLELVGGGLDFGTGMIICGRPASMECNRLLFAPYAVEMEGICAYRHSAEFKALIRCHNDVIILATSTKFGRGGGAIVKYTGHMKKEMLSLGGENEEDAADAAAGISVNTKPTQKPRQPRQYTLIVPSEALDTGGASGSHRRAIINHYRECGVRIIEATEPV